MLVGAAAVVCICIALVSLTAGGIWLIRPTTPQFTIGPAQTYAVSAAKDTRITDSVTGQTLRFPEGGTGNVQIAKITSGPAAPLPGEGIWVDYKGNTTIQLMLEDKGDVVEVFGYGPHPVLRHSTWVPMSEGASVDGHRIYDLYLPSQKPNALGSQPLASLSPLARSPASLILAAQPATPTVAIHQYWVSRIITDTYIPRRQHYIETQIKEDVDHLLSVLPPDLQKKSFDRVFDGFRWQYQDIAKEDISYTGFSKRLGMREPRFWISSDPGVQGGLHQTIPHEVGHYWSHVLLDNIYKSLEAQVRDSHGPGDYWPGRTDFVEEPAYFVEYLFNGPTGGVVGIRDLREPWNEFYKNYGIKPTEQDMPSVEGFGVVFLAALQRQNNESITVWDSGGKNVTTDIPNIGLTDGEIFEILSQGVTNMNQLRAGVERFLQSKGQADKLPAVAQRIGWRYKVKGRLLDPLGDPVEGFTIESISRVGCRDYQGGVTTKETDKDGSFELDQVFPGESWLRVTGRVLADGRQAKWDLPIVIDWAQETNKVVNRGDIKMGRLQLDPKEINNGSPGKYTFKATASGIPPTTKSIRWEWFLGTNSVRQFQKDSGAQAVETDSAEVTVDYSAFGATVDVYLYDMTCGKRLMDSGHGLIIFAGEAALQAPTRAVPPSSPPSTLPRATLPVPKPTTPGVNPFSITFKGKGSAVNYQGNQICQLQTDNVLVIQYDKDKKPTVQWDATYPCFNYGDCTVDVAAGTCGWTVLGTWDPTKLSDNGSATPITFDSCNDAVFKAKGDGSFDAQTATLHAACLSAKRGGAALVELDAHVSK